ncbi:MAG: NAD(P)-dependent oxidoreductase [Acidobacteriaceae bacterium]|nr:NAD(P)-dependent oxidoreductase [Acidobacteriaceae bacterium]MBV8568979.1 NAD(P)-dependent oxidoreductase [Acidobacteriaceae bacterium]
MNHTNNGRSTEYITTGPIMSQVGVIGLGRMGRAFAQLLMAGGLRVVAYDIDADKVSAVLSQGAVAAASVEDFNRCDMVLTSLPDDNAVRKAVLSEKGLASYLKPGGIHLSTSTIGVPFCRELDAAHRERGQVLIAMPVLGNPDLAARRGLFLLLGAPLDAIERSRDVIDLLGQRSFHVGDDPWLASAMKLAGNMLTAATLQSMGEVFAFLSKEGITPHKAQQILTGSLFDGKVHKTYGGRIVERRYSPPGMTVPLATKDLRLLLAEAEQTHTPMPLASLLHDRLIAVEARGWSDLDWSALGRLAAFEASIPEELSTPVENGSKFRLKIPQP